MRVIAGLAKGRKLRSVDSDLTRPTTDRVKEALFSTLGPDVIRARVLDLYAGSGALGIEALSRGAEYATFVESSRQAAAALQANLATTGFEERATVLVRPVAAVLAASPMRPFDLVLADPPYEVGVPSDALRQLVDNGWVTDRAIVVVEVAGRLDDLDVPEGYRIRDTRRYGDSKLVYMGMAPSG